MRFLPTPHVPHNWESGLWFEETTGTLLAGDLFTAGGDLAAITEDDIIEPALFAEDVFHATSMGPDLVPTIERLATLEPNTLALMHGSTFHGDGAAQLQRLAAAYAERSHITV